MALYWPSHMANNNTMQTDTYSGKRIYKALINRFLIVVAIAAVSIEHKAQDTKSLEEELNYTGKSKYTTAIGIRGGGASGLTFKHFVSSGSAIEIIAWGNRNWLGVTGLFELYKTAFDVPGLNWYYGVGAHVNFYDSNWGWSDNRFNENVIGLGVDVIGGIEYKIKPIPMAISLDLKPNVEAYTNGNFGFHLDPGLGVKIAF